MFEIYHGSFVTNELRKLIPKDSFASYLTDCIGRELQSTVEVLDEEYPDGSWGFCPVSELYELFNDGWNLDPEWFEWTDGIYRDDNKNEIPPSVPRTYSSAEQMAAYGLYWARDSTINCMGEPADEGLNDQGWGREGIIEHKAECLLRAYQSLVCAQQLLFKKQTGLNDDPAEIEKSIRTRMARESANKLHEKTTHVKRDAVITYWRTNIGTNVSNELAAEQLQKQFPEMAHRTLTKYVAQAKKLQSAGTL